MKHHINSLPQRQRAEFDGARNARRSKPFQDHAGTTNIYMKDGYDWLQQISRAHLSRVVAS